MSEQDTPTPCGCDIYRTCPTCRVSDPVIITPEPSVTADPCKEEIDANLATQSARWEAHIAALNQQHQQALDKAKAWAQHNFDEAVKQCKRAEVAEQALDALRAERDRLKASLDAAVKVLAQVALSTPTQEPTP